MEKGAFAHFSNVIEMGTYTESLPALGSLRAPIQTLTLMAFNQSLTHVSKTTLHVLKRFNSTLSHLTILYVNHFYKDLKTTPSFGHLIFNNADSLNTSRASDGTAFRSLEAKCNSCKVTKPLNAYFAIVHFLHLPLTRE